MSVKNENEIILLNSFTDICDEYIESADFFRHNKPTENKSFMVNRKWTTVAAAICVLIGIAACGAYVHHQLHIASYDSVEQIIKEKNLKPWETISVMSGPYDEKVYKNSSPEALVDILINGSDEYTVVNGTKADKWNRMIWANYEKSYYEAYDYDLLSDMLSDYQIKLNLDYVESHFQAVNGEYGCDFLYKDETKANYLYRRFFSGYSDEEGRFIGIEYSEDLINKNKDPYYVLDDNSTTTGYMITDDDVEVFITKAVGTYGGRLTTAWVLTEETSLYVNMYGEFSKDEVEEILNSLEIAKILKDK